MDHNRRHRSSSRKSKTSGLESLLTSRLFIVLGVIFLLAGLYYSFSSSDGSGGLYNMIVNFFKPKEGLSEMEVPENQAPILLFYFLPAVILLILSNWYSKRNNAVTYPAALLISIYLIVLNVVLELNFSSSYYSYLFRATVFFVIPALLFFTSFIQSKSRTLVLLTLLYFYISVTLYLAIYFIHFDLFLYILFFGIVLAWVSHKIRRPYLNLIHFIYSLSFLALFWLRKLVVNSKTEFLPEFFLFGILFYILFYGIVLYTSHQPNKPLRKWMQLLITWSNLLFFLGTTSYVLIKYFAFGYLWVVVVALLLLTVLVLYLLKRFNSKVWTFPHYFVGIVLAALVCPLMLHQNMALIFTAGLSVFMLIYTLEFKEKSSMWISMFSVAGMVLIYLYTWASSYLPALLNWQDIPAPSLLWHGVISGVAVTGALWIIKLLLKDAEIPFSKRWFSRTTYDRYIRTLRLIALFFTMGWTGFALVCQATGTMRHSGIALFITGSIFFIVLITYFAGKQSIFKKPMLYFGFVFALVYPLLVQWSMIVFRNDLVQKTDITVYPLLLHYIALVLFVVLGAMTVRRIYFQNAKNPVMQATLQVLTITFLLFTLYSEYDNFSILNAVSRLTPDAVFSTGDEVLAANRHLPYSILAWILATYVFVRAILKKDLFLRNFSMLLFSLVLLKVFAWDFTSIPQENRSAVFFTVGIFLIGFAVVYPRLLKADSKLADSKRKSSKEIQENNSATKETGTGPIKAPKPE